MKAHATRNPGRQPFRPRLEALEGRCCPSCTIFQEGSTLFILGDRADDQVEIVDHGRAGVAVDCLDDDRGPALFTGVTSIQVQTDAGDDSVHYTSGGAEVGGHDLLVVLGDGNDLFEAVFVPPPEGDTPPPTGDSPPPDPDFPFVVEVMAGAGDDVVTARLQQPPPEPDFVFRADLGSGDDRFDVLFQLDPPSDPDNPPPDPDFPPGQFEVLAGTGDDEVAFTFFDIPADVHAFVDLGAGNDSFLGKIEIVDLSRGGPGIAQLDPGNFVGFDVFGRGGDDRFQLDIGSRTGPSPYILNSHVTAQFDGGIGNDAFDIFLGGPDTTPEPLLLNGSVAVSANGGDGSDDMVIAIVNVAVGGDLDISALGGLAEDHLEGGTICPCILPGGEFTLTLDGGANGDRIEGFIRCEGEIAGPMAFSVLGGGGSDLLSTFTICPCVLPGGRGRILVDGQGGNDTILARIAFNPQPDSPSSPWLIDIRGGSGNDSILAQVEFLPPPTGDTQPLFVDFHFRLDGGDGNDLLAARVDFANVDENVRVRAVVELFGGAGNDILGLEEVGKSNPNELVALVDGGDGFDIAFVSRGVLVRNCEVVVFPPGQ